jgi:hypothetical protein
MRAEGLGSSMVHQMAAGAVPLSHPRFDAHIQRDISQHPCAPMGGISANHLPLPHSNTYSQGDHQSESQLRYSLPPSIGPSTHSPFASQKATDPLYLQYAEEHPDSNSVRPLRQHYPMGPANTQPDEQYPRSGSSGSSVESGNGRWPAMYAMHPEDQRQASQPRSQQHLSTTSLGSDVRTGLYHVAATM